LWRSLGGSSREVSARDGSVIERFGDEAQSVLPWASLVKLIEPNHWARHRKRTVSNAGAGRGEGWEDSRQDAAQERGRNEDGLMQGDEFDKDGKGFFEEESEDEIAWRRVSGKSGPNREILENELKQGVPVSNALSQDVATGQSLQALDGRKGSDRARRSVQELKTGTDSGILHHTEGTEGKRHKETQRTKRLSKENDSNLGNAINQAAADKMGMTMLVEGEAVRVKSTNLISRRGNCNSSSDESSIEENAKTDTKGPLSLQALAKNADRPKSRQANQSGSRKGTGGGRCDEDKEQGRSNFRALWGSDSD
jgi:hypothetical protein